MRAITLVELLMMFYGVCICLYANNALTRIYRLRNQFPTPLAKFMVRLGVKQLAIGFSIIVLAALVRISEHWN